jgi:hypothetical protein
MDRATRRLTIESTEIYSDGSWAECKETVTVYAYRYNYRGADWDAAAQCREGRGAQLFAADGGRIDAIPDGAYLTTVQIESCDWEDEEPEILDLRDDEEPEIIDEGEPAILDHTQLRAQDGEIINAGEYVTVHDPAYSLAGPAVARFIRRSYHNPDYAQVLFLDSLRGQSINIRIETIQGRGDIAPVPAPAIEETPAHSGGQTPPSQVLPPDAVRERSLGTVELFAASGRWFVQVGGSTVLATDVRREAYRRFAREFRAADEASGARARRERAARQAMGYPR